MKVSTREIPSMQFRAGFEPASLDAKARTVDITWTTGARVLRTPWFDDPYFEELSLDPAHVRMGRMASGRAPFLANHDSYDVGSVMGVIQSARLEGNQGIATVRFPTEGTDPAADQLFAKIQQGITPNVSVGYRVYKMQKVEDGTTTTPVYRAIDWEPYECSSVPIGADAGSAARSAESAQRNPCEFVFRGEEPHEERHPMELTEEQKRAAAEKALADKLAAERIAEEKRQAELAAAEKREAEVRAEAQKQERERVAGIHHAARAAGLDETFVKQAIDSGMSLDKVRAEALEHLQKRSASTTINPYQRVEMGTTEREKLVRAAKSALIFRLGMMDLAARVREKAKTATGPHMARVAKEFEDIDADGGGELRGFRAVRIAQLLLERAGVRTDSMSDDRIVGRALDPQGLPESMLVRAGGEQTTSDFTVLLENVMYKQLLGNYALADDTWRLFCGTTTVEDFRNSNRYRTGSFGTLPLVPEGEEFQNAPIPDGLKQIVAVQTYGRMLTLSRQAIVNDDMGAIMDTAGKFGRSTGLSIEVAVYNLLNANGGLGNAFNGQSSFFNSAFGNVAASGTGLSSQALDADRVILASQKDVSSNEYLNLAKYGQLTLLVPVSQGGQARVINRNEFEVPVAGATTSKNQTKNMVQGLCKQVVDTPRLSGTGRILFADPGDAAAIMVAFLNGDQTPFLEQKLGWRVDGVEWKLRFDFGAQFFDPKGAVYNAGA